MTIIAYPEDIVKILSIERRSVSAEVQQLLVGNETFQDVDTSLQEDLYSESVGDDEGLLLEHPDFQQIQQLMKEHDCAYFRLVEN